MDVDGDGVSDLRGTNATGANGSYGAGTCDGESLVDADGDGECDSLGTGGQMGGQMAGQGMGRGANK